MSTPQSTAHDLLELLRASIASSTLPTLVTAASEPAPTLGEAAYIRFDSASGPIDIPKDAPSNYLSQVGASETYLLGQLWLAYVERDSGVVDYLQKGQASGVGNVPITDRREVVEYLMGQSDGGDRIVRDEGQGQSRWSGRGRN